MQKQFLLHRYALIFLVMCFYSLGCNNFGEKDSDGERVRADSIGKNGGAAAAPDDQPFAGKLDTLWVTADAFMKLDKRAEFIFHFGGDSITVDGWTDKGGSKPFDAKPNIRFRKGRASDTLYASETYFGNMGLRNIEEIKKIIVKDSATYVIFAPAKMNEHVYYTVLVGKELPTLVAKEFKLIETKLATNPSPPKQYNP